MRFAYLGPEGTYSHEALKSLGLEGVEPVACATIEEVFNTVERGKAKLGIVPIENSLEGSVNQTLDSLTFDTELEIQQEVVRDIHHALVVAPGTKLAEVTNVVSHPQALGQCRRWLTEHLLGKPTSASNSTAEAVKVAIANPGTAAIASTFAAETHGGEVLFDNIEDYGGNQTRFVVIGQGIAERTGRDKTSLALFIKADRPGALLMILSEFAYGGINLTKLQSRPTRKQLGEYMFFVDLEGHLTDPEVELALQCLRLKLRTVKVLGSYPQA